jgi:predicted enzyme related to lactoylglutathione lyase
MAESYQQPPDNCVAFMRIAVKDMERAQKFYAAVFGWAFHAEAYTPNVRVFQTGGQVMGAIHKMPEDAGSKPAILNYVKVADVAAALEKVAAAGGKVVEEKWNEGGHTDMGQFEDTEGNLVGLLHWTM